MRILLAHNSTFYPALGGGDKSNRLLMEALAERGHDIRVVARMEEVSEAAHEKQIRELGDRGVDVLDASGGIVRFQRNGVDVRTVTSNPQLREYFRSQIQDFDPDVILASTDDSAQILLEAALQAERARVVFLARATIALPFGPDAAFQSPAKTRALRTVDGAVGVSHYVAGYIRQWSGIPAIHVPISLVDSGPAPDLGRFENEFVTMVNPCAVKGIDIFTGLAEHMPDIAFAAVPSWGTNERDFARMRAIPNITILEPSDNIDDILRRTRIMLVPSVWAEARSRMVVESMSRGIPVLASDIGGLSEAKLGVPYLLPVNPVVRYKAQYDERMVPMAEVPPQDVTPWVDALRKLVTDRSRFERLSIESRRAALAYIDSIGAEPLEAFMMELCAKPANERRRPPQSELSEEKKKLLAMRLRKKAAPPSEVWFPGIGTARKPVLLCLPYAGAGTLAYRSWQAQLPDAGVVAARLPGRESRLAEPPAVSMDEAVSSMVSALPPLDDFLLYGHSMGAALAFELACALRASSRPLPKALLVSGARAPMFRRDWLPPPDPTPDEFKQELRRLEGVPDEVWSQPEAVEMLLPPLQADAAMYRRYVYQPREPLTCPIFVFGGISDPNVNRQHLEAWAQHTTSRAQVRIFEGGHFFIRDSPDFLESLRHAIASVSN